MCHIHLPCGSQNVTCLEVTKPALTGVLAKTLPPPFTAPSLCPPGFGPSECFLSILLSTKPHHALHFYPILISLHLFRGHQRRRPGEGIGYPLQYSVLESFTDSIVHGVAVSRTGLSDFHTSLKEKRVSEDEMAGCTASPMQWIWTWADSRRWWGTGRPGMLQHTWSQRIGHNWVAEQQLLPDPKVLESRYLIIFIFASLVPSSVFGTQKTLNACVFTTECWNA